MNEPLAQAKDPTRLRASAWRPLFKGEKAVEIRAVVDEIAAALAPSSRPTAAAVGGPAMAEGAAGLAVHYASRYAVTGDERDADAAARYFTTCFDAIGDPALPAGFCNGLAGVGWAGQYVQDQLLEGDAVDLVAEIDGPLLAHLAGFPPRRAYDLSGGVVGLGCHFLARWPRSQAGRGLAAVVDILAGMSTPLDDENIWHTPPGILDADGRAAAPGGREHLGLAHGVAGIVSLVAGMMLAGFRDPRLRDLLDKTMAWLLAREQGPGALGFPPWLDAETGRHPPARLAWGDGECGVAWALNLAARASGEEAWAKRAYRIARRAATVTDLEARVDDAGLWYGAAGVGHVFNRLHQTTGDAVFAQAARRWLGRALVIHRVGRNAMAGANRPPGPQSFGPWHGRRGLASGDAGVALALLASVTDVEPTWDSHLLMGPSPTRGG